MESRVTPSVAAPVDTNPSDATGFKEVKGPHHRVKGPHWQWKALYVAVKDGSHEKHLGKGTHRDKLAGTCWRLRLNSLSDWGWRLTKVVKKFRDNSCRRGGLIQPFGGLIQACACIARCLHFFVEISFPGILRWSSSSAVLCCCYFSFTIIATKIYTSNFSHKGTVWLAVKKCMWTFFTPFKFVPRFCSSILLTIHHSFVSISVYD